MADNHIPTSAGVFAANMYTLPVVTAIPNVFGFDESVTDG
jgi:hypothetical protein